MNFSVGTFVLYLVPYSHNFFAVEYKRAENLMQKMGARTALLIVLFRTNLVSNISTKEPKKTYAILKALFLCKVNATFWLEKCVLVSPNNLFKNKGKIELKCWK